jgi:hypothetical protein
MIKIKASLERQIYGTHSSRLLVEFVIGMSVILILAGASGSGRLRRAKDAPPLGNRQHRLGGHWQVN